MLQRRKAMNNQEHQQAEKSPLNDATMSSIIKDATFLHVSLKDSFGHQQMAPLEKPQQVFARSGRGGAMPYDPDADLVAIPESTPPRSKRKAKARVAITSSSMLCDEPSPLKDPELRTRFELSANGTMDEGAILMTPSKKRVRSKSAKSAAETNTGIVHKEVGLGSSRTDPPHTPVRRATFAMLEGSTGLVSNESAYGLGGDAFPAPQAPSPSRSLFGGAPNLFSDSNVDQCQGS